MDIKKFLKDNKGCPLTVPAIKQLLVKFIELLSTDIDNITEALDDKQDKLVSGDNIKSVGGNSLLGSGNIPISSLELLGSVKLPDVLSTSAIIALFNNVDLSKITSKTLLIFTYDNCFILGMVGQTGFGKVAGLIRRSYTGDSETDYVIGKVTFHINAELSTISVETNVDSGFRPEDAPTAYLFALLIN